MLSLRRKLTADLARKHRGEIALECVETHGGNAAECEDWVATGDYHNQPTFRRVVADWKKEMQSDD